MPRLRIPADTYSKARIISGRDGTDFRAWAKAKALKYNGEPVSCVCTRADSVVVQIVAECGIMCEMIGHDLKGTVNA